VRASLFTLNAIDFPDASLSAVGHSRVRMARSLAKVAAAGRSDALVGLTDRRIAWTESCIGHGHFDARWSENARATLKS
jgi:hypothetical protein